MSVVRQDPDLADHFNTLEAKVLQLVEENKLIKKRLKKIESAAKKHGVSFDNSEAVSESDACIIV
tara:strand:+ start:457 stop:651 length:195 start_codon:yes stop_codon:yes gene_type:complete